MKYESRHIEEIKKLAIELRKELSDQPLNIRRKISSIANLAAVCLTSRSSRAAEVKAIRDCQHIFKQSGCKGCWGIPPPA